MDAVTLVAAAVAIAVDHSRNAALEDCLLDRERQAMRAADLESLVAQRMFSSSWQMPYSRAYGAARRGSWLEAEREATRAAWESDSEFAHESDLEPADNSDAEPVVQIAPQPALQPVQRCGRCASTRNLELLLPTGRWANLPMEQRLFCDACIDAAETP